MQANQLFLAEIIFVHLIHKNTLWKNKGTLSPSLLAGNRKFPFCDILEVTLHRQSWIVQRYILGFIHQLFRKKQPQPCNWI